jgi:hypothetical protein
MSLGMMRISCHHNFKLFLSGPHYWRKLVVDIHNGLCCASSYCSFFCWSIAGMDVVYFFLRISWWVVNPNYSNRICTLNCSQDLVTSTRPIDQICLFSFMPLIIKLVAICRVCCHSEDIRHG